ncbi:MAG TPA: 2-oxoacid:acceptor oxidoreductase family protein [Bacillota bacterium]|nr:2-oxoacid:acceptor oxidoreductase family protein [Bacillota bacterium]
MAVGEKREILLGSRQEVLLTGSGGQGLILAAIILAEAAVNDNKNVVQTQSYGPEARGGASMAGVIIDVDTIEYPKVASPTVLLCMSDAAFRKYLPRVAPGGLVIVDSTFVHGPYPKDFNIYAYPITRMAREKLGREVVANMVALALINAACCLVSRDILKESILQRSPRGSGEINLQAFELGYRLYEQGLESDWGLSAQIPQ